MFEPVRLEDKCKSCDKAYNEHTLKELHEHNPKLFPNRYIDMSNISDKEIKKRKLYKAMGINSTFHLVYEIVILILIISVVFYAFTYDIPHTMKAKICYEYYQSLDPYTNMGKAFSGMVGRIGDVSMNLTDNSGFMSLNNT